MAKYKKKDSEIDAVLFDSTKPESQWPTNVVVNENSPTGFSVGTLEILFKDMGDNKEYPYIDGFIVIDGNYIITNHDNTQNQMTPEVFENNFMLL